MKSLVFLTALFLAFPAFAQTDLNSLFRGGEGAAAETANSAQSLALPHRRVAEIDQWLTSVISETMNFTQADVNQDLQKTRDYFNEEGRAQYIQSLRDHDIAKALQSGRYTVRNYVEGTPLLLNEGALDGRYRWLFQVPVTLTFLETGVRDYKEVQPINKTLEINVQVGRVDTQAMDEIGLLIETWAAKNTEN